MALRLLEHGISTINFFSFIYLHSFSMKLKYKTPATLNKFQSIFRCKLRENMDKDNFI